METDGADQEDRDDGTWQQMKSVSVCAMAAGKRVVLPVPRWGFTLVSPEVSRYDHEAFCARGDLSPLLFNSIAR